MGEVTLSDTEVKLFSVNDLPRMEIELDFILDYEIEVAEGTTLWKKGLYVKFITK